MKLRFALVCCLLSMIFVRPGLGESPRSFTDMDVFQLEFASDPQISPDGNRIIYVRNSMDIMKDRSRAALWTINSDGSDHRRLTAGESKRVLSALVSGRKTAYYVARTDEGSEIFLRWMDTGQTARLTQLSRSPRGLRWSPDGKYIAFSMLVPEDPPQLVRPPKKPEGAEWAEPPRVITRLKHEADGVGYLEPGYNHLFVLPVEGGRRGR